MVKVGHFCANVKSDSILIYQRELSQKLDIQREGFSGLDSSLSLLRARRNDTVRLSSNSGGIYKIHETEALFSTSQRHSPKLLKYFLG